MFQMPYLCEIESLYREASDPAHGVFGDNTNRDLHDRFHAVTGLGLGISDEKKLIEANKLVLFALHFPGFPDSPVGKVVAGENPDFRIILPNRRIGVELTDLYIGGQGKNSMRMQEEVRDRIIARALDLHKSRGGQPMSVRFNFNSNTNFRKFEIGRIAEQLVDCVPTALNLSAGYQYFNVHNRSPWLQGLVSFSVQAPYGGPENIRWSDGSGGTVHSSSEFLQNALTEKEKRLRRYRESGCDEFWLLVTAPGFTPSSFLDAPNPEHVFRSSFNRVFFFELYESKVIELKCKVS